METSHPCDACLRRSALIMALAPAISRLSFTREGLLGLLSLPEDQLLHAAKVKHPREFSRRLDLSRPLPTNNDVPTAPCQASPSAESASTVLCRHDPDYPEALAHLDCAPAALHATCTTKRPRELLTGPAVAIVGGREYSDGAHRITVALARELATAGVTVISGIDQGLEATAHRSALDAWRADDRCDARRP